MKRIFFILTIVLLVAIFASCNRTNSNIEDTATSSEISEAETTLTEDTGISETENITADENTETTEITEYNTVANDPLPSKSIEIRDFEKLNEMREMVTCEDETRLSQYIQSIADSGIQSKDELITFVKLIDSLPHISILDGNVTGICFSHSISEDTGKETNVVYVTTEAENGDWTRVEYVLSVTDVAKKISDEKISVGENSLLTSPVKDSDGKLTLHIETRNPHQSGEGTMILWVGEAEGIFTRIYYYAGNADDVNTDNLFSNI